ncbi:MAG: hypothetical protein ABIN67_05225 [Ferruginibacter sp.]
MSRYVYLITLLIYDQMKKLLLLPMFIIPALVLYGQSLSLNDLFAITLLTPPKFDSYILEHGFVDAGKDYQGDTVVNLFNCRRIINEPGKLITTINKSLSRYNVTGESLITYQTEDFNEFLQIKQQVKSAGFLCYANDSIISSGVLYQKNDLSVYVFTMDSDSAKQYAFRVKRKMLPKVKSVRFAEDLLQFTSHEYLAYVFGEKNVKKDVYFFSENELAKCSVLFLNTDRQAVFLWEDGENNCTLSNLLIGGQQMLKSSLENNSFVSQNNWRLKNGMHAGMTLYELRMLNGQDFKFYSGNSDHTGMVLSDISGKVNFDQQGVILGCMNCRDSKFMTTSVMSAEEAIGEQRILFILSIILSPITASHNLNP